MKKLAACLPVNGHEFENEVLLELSHEFHIFNPTISKVDDLHKLIHDFLWPTQMVLFMESEPSKNREAMKKFVKKQFLKRRMGSAASYDFTINYNETMAEDLFNSLEDLYDEYREVRTQ